MSICHILGTATLQGILFSAKVFHKKQQNQMLHSTILRDQQFHTWYSFYLLCSRYTFLAMLFIQWLCVRLAAQITSCDATQIPRVKTVTVTPMMCLINCLSRRWILFCNALHNINERVSAFSFKSTCCLFKHINHYWQEYKCKLA